MSEMNNDFELRIATEIYNNERTLNEAKGEESKLYLTGYVNGLRFLKSNYYKDDLMEAKSLEIANTMRQIAGIFRNQLKGFLDGINFK